MNKTIFIFADKGTVRNFRSILKNGNRKATVLVEIRKEYGSLVKFVEFRGSSVRTHIASADCGKIEISGFSYAKHIQN